jgi:hypothetical protein
VTVTLADETLTGVVQGGGAWSVTAAALSDGPHRVVLSVSDAAGNPAASTQTLTVDTVSPVVTITGGATATTNDVDPTITGTADAAPGATVTVSIAGQTMTTLVQANGTWNATPPFVGAGTWPVVASAPDPAGNVGRATQTLTIAAAAPSPAPVPAPAPAPAVAGSSHVTPTPAPSGGLPSINAVARTTVGRDRSQKVNGSSLSIGTKVTAPAEGPVVATANGTVRIKGVKKAIRLTSATATVAAGHSATLKLRPTGSKKAATAALTTINKAAGNGKKVTATITVTIVDATGNTRHVKRTVELTT